MPDWTNGNGLSWRALEPFGVELDADLSAPMPPETIDRFLTLLRDHALVVAHDQSLTMEQQVALMEPVGPLVLRPQENGYISTDADQKSSRTELSFHADAAYTDAPFAALSLHAVDVVDGASSTRFASAERAYAMLPDDLRQMADSSSAEMISPTLEGVGVRASENREVAATLRAEFPAIRVNPRTGRPCIGVSEMHTARLLGMEWEESRAALSALFDRLYAPDNVVEHVWRRGDIVIWDNLTLQHARGSLEGAGRRVLQRVVAGVSGQAADMELFAQAARF